MKSTSSVNSTALLLFALADALSFGPRSLNTSVVKGMMEDVRRKALQDINSGGKAFTDNGGVRFVPYKEVSEKHNKALQAALKENIVKHNPSLANHSFEVPVTMLRYANGHLGSHTPAFAVGLALNSILLQLEMAMGLQDEKAVSKIIDECVVALYSAANGIDPISITPMMLAAEAVGEWMKNPGETSIRTIAPSSDNALKAFIKSQIDAAQKANAPAVKVPSLPGKVKA